MASPAISGRATFGGGPGVAVGADEGVDDPEQTDRTEGQSRHVQAAGRPPRLLDPPDDREDGQADGHVEPEDPLPGRPLGDGASDQRTEGHGQAARRPRRSRAALPFARRGRRGRGW